MKSSVSESDVLQLPARMLKAIEQQARNSHPVECCGIITRDERTGAPARLVPMVNVRWANDFFEFEPLAQLKVWREMDALREELWVIYHSHTASRPYPSADDIAYAQSFAGVLHLIVSTDPRFALAMACYRIQRTSVQSVSIHSIADIP